MDRRNGMSEDRAIAEHQGAPLSTARSALQVLTLLEQRPDGVRAEEVAATLGKSMSSAYYLLRAICDEGFAMHDQHGGVYRAASRGAPERAATHDEARRELSLAALADELFARTHKRSYVGVLEGGAIEIVEVRGRQGLRRQPGLGDRISDLAHATGMGKIVLSLMRPVAVERYFERGLRRVAPATITDPQRIRDELTEARRNGFAVDVEELAPNFCCIAAPVYGDGGGLRAVVGVSMSCHAFRESLELLSRVVREVADTRLAPPPRAPGPSTLEKSTVS